jgi:hypothetical protein
MQVPIHFGLLCDMREELSDLKWQDCDPQSWSLWKVQLVYYVSKKINKPILQVGVCSVGSTRRIQFSAIVGWSSV